MSDSSSSTNFSFRACTTVSDFFVVVADMQASGVQMRTSSDRVYTAADLASALYTATHAYTQTVKTTALEDKPLTPELLDACLTFVTSSGGLRETLRAILVKTVTAESIRQNQPFIPERLVRHIWEQSTGGEDISDVKTLATEAIDTLRVLNNRELGLEDGFHTRNINFGFVMPEFKNDQSFQELLCHVYERETLSWGTDRNGKPRSLDSEEVLKRIASVVKNRPEGQMFPILKDRALMVEVLRFKEQGARMPASFTAIYKEYYAEREQKEAAELQQQLNRAASEAPTRILPTTPPEPSRTQVLRVENADLKAQNRELHHKGRRGMLMGLMGAGALVAGTVCSGAVGVHKYSKSGETDETPEVTDMPEYEDWGSLTPAEVKEVNAHYELSQEHYVPYARALIKAANTGLDTNGVVTSDAGDRQEALGVIRADVDTMFDLNGKFGNRILGFYEEPIVTTLDDGSEEIEYPAVAKMSHKETPDDISDDQMGINRWWLDRWKSEGRAPGHWSMPSVLYHEVGHQYTGGIHHYQGDEDNGIPGVADLPRFEAEFIEAVLEHGDLPYSVTFLFDSSNFALHNHFSPILQDMAKRNSNSVTRDDMSIDQAAEFYRIPDDKADRWYRDIARDTISNCSAFKEMGITATELAGALEAGKMHAVANEQLESKLRYEFEIKPELERLEELNDTGIVPSEHTKRR